MSKILQLCSFAFLSVFSILTSDPSLGLDRYLLHVTSVDPESQSYVLSNKIVFHLAIERWGEDQLPLVGAEVWLHPRCIDVEKSSVQEKGDFYVRYLYPFQQKTSSVWMSEESKEHCLSYIGMKSVCIQPAGWFSSAVYRDVIELSDGSEWMVQMERSFSFKKGDRIVLTRVDQELWGIIDIDQKWIIKGKDGKNYRCNQAIEVTPYEL